MKKIYLIALAALSVSATAQNSSRWGNNLQETKVSREVQRDITPPSPVRILGEAKGPDHATTLNKKTNAWVIGTTQNDQQSNASVYRHLHVFGDGQASATWTTSNDPAPFDSRGAGYNHFDGTSWGPISSLRIDLQRTGFPCYVYSPTSSEEIITAHKVNSTTGAAGGVLMHRKPVAGSTWTSTSALDTVATLPGVLWVQTAIAGDYMIAIGSFTDSTQTQPNRIYIDSIRTPQVYSRYQISTNTWLVKNKLLPGYTKERVYAGGGDNYSIDAKGNNVAILMGGTFDDLALWKSTDAGATWTKTIIDSFPVPAYNKEVLFDTTETNDGAVNVTLDNSGMAHCFWGRRLILDDTLDGQYSYFANVNGIMYWKEGTPTNIHNLITSLSDESGDGKNSLQTNWNDKSARYGNTAICTMPYAVVGPDGTIYLTYTSLSENDISTDTKNFRDIYLVYSRDNGNTWSATLLPTNSSLSTGAINLTSWIEYNTEQVQASMASLVNDKIYLTFMHKSVIGMYDAKVNPGGAGTHKIYYMSVDTSSIFTNNISGVSDVKNELFEIGQNFPNPFKANTSIPVSFKRSTDVKVSVIDLLGKEIYSNEFHSVPTGSSKLDLNLGSIPAGVYIYSVEAEGMKTSRRMLLD